MSPTTRQGLSVPFESEPPKAAPAPAAPRDDERQAPGTYPVTYYNPKVIDERFYVIDSPYPRRFVRGAFVATNANEEESVRRALAAHGRDVADRWRGDDRVRPWTDKRTGFTTLNEAARYDFEYFHED